MLLDKIGEHARREPGKAALVQDGVTWTYAQLLNAVLDARAHLAAQGLNPGSVAVLAIRPLAQAWVWGMALRSLGITTIAIPATLDVRSLPLRIETLLTLEGDPLDGGSGQLPWRALAVPAAQPAADAQPRAVPAFGKQGGHVLLTSGTTGAYKLILRDALDEFHSLPGSLKTNDLGPESVVFVGNFPLLTAGGYRWPLATWYAGGTVIFCQRSNPLQSLLGLGANQAYATPATLSEILRAQDPGLPRNAGLRILVTGGTMPLALWQDAQRRLGNMVSMMGSTEALNLTITPVEQPDDLRWHRVHPSREVQVVDESDHPVPAGHIGLLRAKLTDGLRGYLGEPELSRQFFRGDWFYPGDLAAFGADGRLALHGRATEVLNVMGNKVAPAPIEQILADKFGAEGVCLFDAPNAHGEEELHVAVQPRRPLQHQDLEDAAKNILRSYPMVHFHIVDSLPRNHMGKLMRLQVRQQIFAKKPG